nr:MAG TPA: hypothetical protein [Bacteriophage sp.]DAF14644.1 MAG TPA: hypothetical protein [Crassvirales sp.]
MAALITLSAEYPTLPATSCIPERTAHIALLSELKSQLRLLAN